MTDAEIIPMPRDENERLLLLEWCVAGGLVARKIHDDRIGNERLSIEPWRRALAAYYPLLWPGEVKP